MVNLWKKSIADYKPVEINEEPVENKNSDVKISLVKTFWNIVSCTTGTVLISIPYVIKIGGWFSIVALVIVAVISNYTAQILIKCHYKEEKIENSDDIIRLRVRNSFAEIGGAVWPRYGKQVTLFVQALELLLVTTAYVVISVSILRVLTPNIASIGWILILGLVIYPNMFVKQMRYISLVSKITVISAAIIMLSIVTYCLVTITDWKHPPMFTITSYSDYISGVGILISSFSSQMYLSVIESSMKEPERIEIIMGLGFIISLLIKAAIGVFAYMRFGVQTADIITLNIPHGAIFIMVNVGVLFLALSSYSLPMFTVFEILENDSNLLGNGQEEGVSNKFRRYGIRTLLFLIPLSIGYCIPHVFVMMSFIGCSTSSLLTITLPCIFYVILKWDELSKLELSFNMFLISSSTMLTVVGTYISGLDMVNAFKYNIKDIWSMH